jgi:hypothetical protein
MVIDYDLSRITAVLALAMAIQARNPVLHSMLGRLGMRSMACGTRLLARLEAGLVPMPKHGLPSWLLKERV